MAERKVPYEVNGRSFEGMIAYGDSAQGNRGPNQVPTSAVRNSGRHDFEPTCAVPVMLFRSSIGLAMVRSVSKPSPVPRIVTVP